MYSILFSRTRSLLPWPLTVIRLLLLFFQRRAGKLSVGPILLGFFFIVIVGSCECCRELNALATRVADMPSLAVSRSTALLQIIRQAGG